MHKVKILAILLVLSNSTTAFAKSKLATEITGTFSDYKYKEPGFMDNKGNMYGIDIGFNLKPNENQPLFLGLQLALSTGKVDYSSQGTGSINREDNDKQEARILAGFTQDIYSPYLGFGYRRLVNDSSGMISTTGHKGYKRISQYYYLPVGVGIDVFSNKDIKLKTKLEYDYLIKGKQESDLTSFGMGNVNNDQKSGYGYRFALQMATPINKSLNMLIEPFYEYWNIKKSEDQIVATSNNVYRVYEPKNNTREFGVKIGIGF